MGFVFPKMFPKTDEISQKRISEEMGNCLKVLILLGFQRFLFDLRFPQKHISENTLCQRAISFILFWGKVSILLMHESSSKIMKLSFLKQTPFDFPFPQILFFSDFRYPHKIQILCRF